MGQSLAYAYLKTIDGDEVMEFSRKSFEKVIETLRFREVQKSDRTIYYVVDNTHLCGINFYREDYFEIVD